MPVEPRFIPLADTDRDAVVAWVSSEVWPFHSYPYAGPPMPPTPEQVAAAWDDQGYIGPDVRGFWLEVEGERVGIVRLQDIEEGNTNPCFDLRLKPGGRNRGVGTATLRWLTTYVFDQFPQFSRLEGQTREDNLAMRRVFRRCGYVKEAHYRAAWPAGEGRLLASIGYAMLRDDWTSGRTTPVNWDDEPDQAP